MWQRTILANVSPDRHNKSIQQSIRWVPKQSKRDGGLWLSKGIRISPLEQQRILKSLKPVLSDCTPNTEFWVEHFRSPPLSPSTPSTRQAEYQLKYFCFNTTGSWHDLELWENSSMKILNWNNLEITQVLSQMTVWLVRTERGFSTKDRHFLTNWT